MSTPNTLQPGQLIRMKKLIEITGIPKATIYRFMEDGTFPKQLKIGKRLIAWRTEDIITWMKNLG